MNNQSQLMKTALSEKIRSIRESRGYSQDYVARRLRVTQQAYSNMEKKPDHMALKRLVDLTEVLEIDLVSLLHMVEQHAASQHPASAVGHSLSGLMNGHAANGSVMQSELYQRLINILQEEINFLRSLNI